MFVSFAMYENIIGSSDFRQTSVYFVHAILLMTLLVNARASRLTNSHGFRSSSFAQVQVVRHNNEKRSQKQRSSDGHQEKPFTYMYIEYF